MTSSPRDGRTPVALSIAGSDSGGGAGIQADLKAFARSGVHGTTAITAITWQNTVEVRGVTPVPAEAIVGQVRAVVDDIRVDAVKIGMLGTVETIAAVEQSLDLVSAEVPIVIDPVMVSESGARLLDERAVIALRRLIGRATVVTPNLAEARVLAGSDGFADCNDPQALARAVAELCARMVVVTGGHFSGDEVVDTIWDGDAFEQWRGPRYDIQAAHGSGCTHSAALAAFLARGMSPVEAAKAASEVAAEAVRRGLADLGAGAGPVDVLGISEARGAGRPAGGADG